jgi:DNA-binding HxlR family transcriptional regulator
LRDLLDHRWSIPVLAELHRAKGSRFVPLAHRVGAGRESLRRSLDALIDAGLVEPNPGYGHPSRPEYVLTEKGRRVAPACGAVLDALERERVKVGLRRWTLPVLVQIGRGRRFSELKSLLPGVTPAALADVLKELAAAELVARTVHDAFPPHASYRATARGRAIATPARRLAAALAPKRVGRLSRGRGAAAGRSSQAAASRGP